MLKLGPAAPRLLQRQQVQAARRVSEINNIPQHQKSAKSTLRSSPGVVGWGVEADSVAPAEAGQPAPRSGCPGAACLACWWLLASSGGGSQQAGCDREDESGLTAGSCPSQGAACLKGSGGCAKAAADGSLPMPGSRGASCCCLKQQCLGVHQASQQLLC